MSTKPKNKLKHLRLGLFFALVVLPWLAITAYVGLLAQPRYVSTATVVIKQVNEQNLSAGGISALLGINSTSKEDAIYLTEFILSQDLITRLDKTQQLSEHYQNVDKDFINRLPKDATQEELHQYFKKRVKVNLDDLSSVLTIETEGFSPEFALKLNHAILTESEQFVNRISRQVAAEQMAFSEAQLDEAQARLNATKKALLDYQNENEIFDPEANAQIVNQVIAGLQGQLASLRTEERQLLSYLNPEAPQVVAIRNQISAVEKQIREEQAKLTSPVNATLNEKAVEFEAIKADVTFATELYKLSLTSLEKARLEALRKMKNLVIISSPHKAEEAMYPRHGYVISISLVFLLIFYGFVMLILAVIRDHGK